MVVGCGPVGLAVISALKARGLGPVIACDFSAEEGSGGRALMGADRVIDPVGAVRLQPRLERLPDGPLTRTEG